MSSFTSISAVIKISMESLESKNPFLDIDLNSMWT